MSHENLEGKGFEKIEDFNLQQSKMIEKLVEGIEDTSNGKIADETDRRARQSFIREKEADLRSEKRFLEGLKARLANGEELHDSEDKVIKIENISNLIDKIDNILPETEDSESKKKRAKRERVIYKHIKLEDEFTPAELRALKADQTWQERVTNALNEYNKRIDTNGFDDSKAKYLKEFQDLKAPFSSYMAGYEKDRKEKMANFEADKFPELLSLEMFIKKQENLNLLRENADLYSEITGLVNQYNELRAELYDADEIASAYNKIMQIGPKFRKFVDSHKAKLTQTEKPKEKVEESKVETNQPVEQVGEAVAKETKPDEEIKNPEQEKTAENQEADKQAKPAEEDIFAQIAKETNFTQWDIEKYFKPEDFKILKGNKNLYKKAKKAFDAYNKVAENDYVGHEPKRKAAEKIETVRLEFEEYKKTIPEELEDKADTETQEQEAPTPEEEMAPESNNEVENEENVFLTPEQMIIITEGEDYSHIDGDKKFDTWFKNIYQNLEKSDLNTAENARTLENWYAKYQESLPFLEKIDAIFEDIEKTQGKRTEDEHRAAKALADVQKRQIMFDLFRGKEGVKSKIEGLNVLYTQSLEQRAEIEDIKKKNGLKKTIEEKRKKKPETALEDKEVNTILGKERIEEINYKTVVELLAFLHDMRKNYDYFDQSVAENSANNMSKAYDRYRTVVRDESGEVKKFKSGLNYYTTSKKDFYEGRGFLVFSRLVSELRKQDLVNRKNGDSKAINEIRMDNLITLVEDNPDLIHDYTNAENVGGFKTPEYLSEDEKKAFNSFKAMYSAYRDVAKKTHIHEEAEQELKDIDPDAVIDEDTDQPEDILFAFDDEAEAEKLRNEAEYDIAKGFLENFKHTAKNYNKKNKMNRDELSAVCKRFEESKATVEHFGNDETDALLIKTTEKKFFDFLHENVNTENLQEISKHFHVYDRILKSNKLEKKDKKQYVEKLLEDLKKIRNNPENTVVVNAQLDAIIEKYQKELKSIK